MDVHQHEVAAAGARTANPLPALAILSRRETEVLRLVGDGLTSREIAARLFLSTRTVEMHVQNAKTKLGSRTRAAAVLRLADQGRQ